MALALALSAFEGVATAPVRAGEVVFHGMKQSAFENHVSLTPHNYEGAMSETRGNMPRTVRGTNAPKSPNATDNNVFSITAWARRYPAKEGARLTRMTPKGFQKVQAGECSLSYDKFTNWMKSDPDFAAAYAAHVGLILPGDAEFSGALTRAVNAYVRKDAAFVVALMREAPRDDES